MIATTDSEMTFGRKNATRKKDRPRRSLVAAKLPIVRQIFGAGTTVAQLASLTRLRVSNIVHEIPLSVSLVSTDNACRAEVVDCQGEVVGDVIGMVRSHNTRSSVGPQQTHSYAKMAQRSGGPG